MRNEDHICLSVRATSIILSIFSRAREYQPINRNALFLEAIEHARKTTVDWRYVATAASEYNTRSASADSGPDFIQLRLPRTQWEDIINSINSAFKASLKRLHTSYAVKLVMINYLYFLEGIINIEETRKEYPILDTKEIDAPELSLLLTKMILENSAALNDIQAIMIKYKRGDYDR